MRNRFVKRALHLLHHSRHVPVVFTIIILVAGAGVTLNYIGIPNEAAWVQALGSILAIYFTAVIVNHQMVDAENTRYADELRGENLKLAHLAAIFQHLAHAIESELDRMKDDRAADFYRPEHIETALSRLHTIPAFDIPGVDISSKVHLTMTHIQSFLARAAAANKLLPAGIEDISDEQFQDFYRYLINPWQTNSAAANYHLTNLRDISSQAIDECRNQTAIRDQSLKHIADFPWEVARSHSAPP